MTSKLSIIKHNITVKLKNVWKNNKPIFEFENIEGCLLDY